MSDAVVYALLDKNSREKLRVSAETFAGKRLIQVRIMAKLSDTSGVWVPTKKGAAISLDQLPAVIAALQQAERDARAAGLIR